MRALPLSFVVFLAACSFDLSKHQSACKVTADCKQAGYYCYESLCVEGPGGGNAGINAGGTAGSGAGGHAAAGKSGGGASGVNGGTGSPALDAGLGDLDALIADPDAGMTGNDAGPISGIPTLPTCNAWTPSHDATCPAVCSGGCEHDVCNIACKGISCVNTVVTCPDGYACLVSCTDPNTCTSFTLQCADGPCDLVCSGTNACTVVTLICGDDACRATCSAGTGVSSSFVGGMSCGMTKPGCP